MTNKLGATMPILQVRKLGHNLPTELVNGRSEIWTQAVWIQKPASWTVPYLFFCGQDEGGLMAV